MLTIYVVSDSTGETAERVVGSALVQFRNARTKVIRRSNIRLPKQVRALLREAAAQQSFVIHTLVSHRLRRLMLSESRALGVDAMDLMGPLIERLSTHLRIVPTQKPGLFKQLVEAKSRQIEAVEFAFRHDDGLQVRDLKRAEIVLVGVSRTMKTPVSIYLAYRGWFAANVPIIYGIPLPPELLKLPASRIFCLVANPVRLRELRLARVDAFSLPETPYASLLHVRKEMLLSRHLSRDHGWRQIEVTGKSVEEVAREIVVLMSVKKHRDPAPW